LNLLVAREFNEVAGRSTFINELRVLIIEDDVFIAMNLAELIFETLAAVPIAVRSVGQRRERWPPISTWYF